MLNEKVLIGWSSIEIYMKEVWSIPIWTIQEYKRAMREGGYVCKRSFGMIPDRRVKVFALPSKLDEFVVETFRQK